MKYAPYSFSKINCFFECPKKFDYSYVNKIDKDDDYRDPSYFVRGRFIHSYIANRLSGGDGTLNKFSGVDVYDKLHLAECAEKTLSNDYVAISYDFDTNGIEKQIFLSKKMTPSNNARAAMKGYIDYYAVHDDFAMIIDWKSGKYRPDANYDQLELYAIWVLERHPEITEIDLVFYYVEHNKFSVKTVEASEVESFKKKIVENVDIIENEENFNPTPSKRSCLHCAYFDTCSEEHGIML
jgi:CRISPR/Cas system-associated exonuclease Cas4 (RecB family)